jgi:predicted dehydrogenase
MAAKSSGTDRRFKLLFIGAGGRSVVYAEEYAKAPEVEIVALADPAADKRAQMIKVAKLPPEIPVYDDWRPMAAAHPDIDGAVICSPNHLHAEHAIPFLERGLPIVLEKPLATTKEDCENIISAERLHGGRTLIGFVLRSAPFYRQIHDLIRNGAVGRIVAIEADELVRWLVSGLFVRGPWRRFQATSGGAMLEKCCHDLDILNWLMDCRPVALHSYGGRRMFSPNPALPETCDGCGVAGDCRYYMAADIEKHEDRSEQRLHWFMGVANRCVYNIDKDIADVQAVGLEYENGAVANFLYSLNVGGSHGGRNIRVLGVKGSIWGNINEMKVTLFENRTEKETVFPIVSDGSGHGGGDHRHCMEYLRMLREPDYRPDQNAQAGYLSAVMAQACDVSRNENRRVYFHYRANGFVDLA